MLKFYGTAYDQNLTEHEFEVKALSEKEAKEKIKAKYRKRKKPLRLQNIHFVDVEIVPKVCGFYRKF